MFFGKKSTRTAIPPQYLQTSPARKMQRPLAAGRGMCYTVSRKGGIAVLIQNLALYEDQYAIRVNREGDPLFYFFDYDVRTADINMQFQHFHSFYELCILLSPVATHFLEGKPYRLQAFDILGIPPSVLHMTQYPEGEGSRRLIVRFNLPRTVNGLGDEYDQLLQVFHQKVPIFRFPPEVRGQLYRKLNEIFLLAEKTDPMRDLIIHVKFVEFLTLLYLRQADNEYENQTALTPAQRKMYDVAAYIHAHCAEPLSLDTLSQQFFVSGCYLSHQFRAVTGFTLTDYIQLARVRSVQTMLLNTDLPITDAAMRSGFASFSQFNRVFRKHVGMSPTQYRREGR